MLGKDLQDFVKLKDDYKVVGTKNILIETVGLQPTFKIGAIVSLSNTKEKYIVVPSWFKNDLNCDFSYGLMSLFDKSEIGLTHHHYLHNTNFIIHGYLKGYEP